MRRFFFGVVALMTTIVLSREADTARSQAVSRTGSQRAIDDRVSKALSEHGIPGMSVAVVEEDRVVYAKGFGTTSLVTIRRPSADTQYRLASVSKPLTAVGVFRLVQDGAVKVDTPAREYCPELARLNGAPTVRHLLMHRSGMRHTTDSEDVSIKGAFPRLGLALRKIAEEPLRFTPGTKTQYSSWGYAALGCVIEGASGRSYADFMKARVFGPAGMNATTFDYPEYTSPTFSPGFRRGILYGLRPSAVVDTRFKTPASGIISTVNDLARFAIAIFERTVVNDAQVNEMFRIQPDAEGHATFTAGWSTSSSGLSKATDDVVFDFNGSMEGSTAYLEVAPSRRYAFALLANKERSVPEVVPIAADVRGLVLTPSSTRR